MQTAVDTAYMLDDIMKEVGFHQNASGPRLYCLPAVKLWTVAWHADLCLIVFVVSKCAYNNPNRIGTLEVMHELASGWSISNLALCNCPKMACCVRKFIKKAKKISWLKNCDSICYSTRALADLRSCEKHVFMPSRWSCGATSHPVCPQTTQKAYEEFSSLFHSPSQMGTALPYQEPLLDLPLYKRWYEMKYKGTTVCQYICL